jgi:hypothetical protein
MALFVEGLHAFLKLQTNNKKLSLTTSHRTLICQRTEINVQVMWLGRLSSGLVGTGGMNSCSGRITTNTDVSTCNKVILGSAGISEILAREETASFIQSAIAESRHGGPTMQGESSCMKCELEGNWWPIAPRIWVGDQHKNKSKSKLPNLLTSALQD